ncbi:MAG TPA: L,D-transpeptidase [Solirubrobacteraceae bacterium]|nr:L,D-transpeptidase [Solirubrobacteraceae bacterium]
MIALLAVTSAVLPAGAPAPARAVAVFSTGTGSLAGLPTPPPPAPGAGSLTQRTVVLLHDRVARIAPDIGARKIGTVRTRRPLTRVRTVLPLLGDAKGSDGSSWLHVRLPGRPNGHTGWIPAIQTRRARSEWHIRVDLSLRRVTIRRDGQVIRRFRAAVGKPATPTPIGRFFIEEALALSPQDDGGPFALATSARSSVLQEFAGGPGQIALHGTNNLATVLGTAVSHGCVRLSTRAITWLARRIRAGVPLTITR